jgi:DNA-binding transcriptional regulator YiaG
MKNYSTQPPTANQIREARLQAGMTLNSASQLLYVHIDTWSKWESGARAMHPAFWELFMRKLGEEQPQ